MPEPYILLVEDNPNDEALTLRALTKSHLITRVVVTRDGAEALDQIYARGAFADRVPGLPLVVLLDINLPKLSGLEVLRELRSHEQTRDLPVVMLTSSHEDIDLTTAYHDGANSYVIKPVGFAEFSEAVGRVGLYWSLVNAAPPSLSNP